MAVTIRRLEESDELENFDCGDEPLNNYLKRHAWTNQEKISIGVTYVAIDDSAPYTVLGYFTLATSSVPRDRLPKKYVRGLPPYDLPLILLARLAVALSEQGNRLGQGLLHDALARAAAAADIIGARAVLVQAIDEGAAFYTRFGFEPSPVNPHHLMLIMKSIRVALRLKS